MNQGKQNNIVLYAKYKNKSNNIYYHRTISGAIYNKFMHCKIYISYQEFIKQNNKDNLFANIVYIKILEKTFICRIQEIQEHPITNDPIHIDLKLINYYNKITIPVKIKIKNQEKSSKIKTGSITNLIKKYIKINALPEHIPRYIEIDIAKSGVKANILVKDIIVTPDIKIDEQENTIILSIKNTNQEKDIKTNETVVTQENKK